jgi:hypothetical protein
MKTKVANLTRLLAALLFSFLLWGCASTPKTNLAPDLFPTALLAEPIKMRAGFTHTTQPFEITGPDQVWEVNIGFKRQDDKLKSNRFFCLTTSKKDSLHKHVKCDDETPKVHIRWSLIRADGADIGGHTYDASVQDTNTQSSRLDYQVGLRAFTNQPRGIYTLKVYVLRDQSELEATNSFIVIGKPFFRKR